MDGNRIFLISGVALFAVFLFSVLFLHPTDDIPAFYSYWIDIRDNGISEGIRGHGLPPLAFLFIMVPGALSWSEQSYYVLHEFEMFLLCWLSIRLVYSVAGRLNLDKGLTTILYVVVLLLYSEEALKKLDMAVAVCVLVSVYLYLRGNAVTSYVFVILGAMIKIYPIALVPIFFILALVFYDGKERLRRVGGYVAVTAVFGILSVGAVLFAGGDIGHLSEFMFAQSDRNFQIESTVGNLAHIIGLTGAMEYSLVFSCGTHDIICAMTDFLKPYWTGVVCSGIIIFCAVLALRLRNVGAEDRDLCMVLCACTMVLMLLLSFQLFSTQYMLWAVTLIPFMIMSERSRDTRRMATLIFVLMIPVLLPHMIWLLWGVGEVFSTVAVLLRNIMLFAMFCICLRRLFLIRPSEI